MYIYKQGKEEVEHLINIYIYMSIMKLLIFNFFFHQSKNRYFKWKKNIKGWNRLIYEYLLAECN